ncbi:MAG: glycosyltransferase family 39 protein [Nitrospirae bacterium]|nr:glycosyltransferase family 39 protein [Nitrospirota bacterium]
MKPSKDVSVPSAHVRYYHAWAAASFLVPLALFLYYGGHPLWDEEAMFIEVPREMLASGDFLYPTLNYAPFLFKPPLFLWANATSLALFGYSELAARLPNALFAAGTVLTTFFIGSRSGLRTGIFSAAVLATSFGLVFHTSSMLADIPLMFFTATSVCFFLESLNEKRGAVVGLYASLALAVMTKGFLGLVFPGVAFVGLIILDRLTVNPSFPRKRESSDFLLKRFISLPGAIVFLIITLPWHVAMELRNPGFLYNFIVNEQVMRFFNERFPPDYDNVTSPVFIAVTLAWMMPWAVFFFQGVAAGFRRGTDTTTRAALVWGLGGMFFLSLASSKMEYYSLPLFPAFALIIGGWWARLVEDDRLDLASSAVIGAGVLALASLAGIIFGDRIVAELTDGMWLSRSGPADTSATASLVFGILLAGSAATLALLLRRSCDAAFGVFFAGALLMSAAAHGSLGIAEPFYSSAKEAKALAGLMKPDDVLVLDGDMEYEYCATFNYYTGKRAYILPNDGHPILPVKFEESDRFVLTGPEMTRLWASGGRVYFVTMRDPEVIREISDLPRKRLSGGVKMVYLNSD